ncbi:Methyltransferase type 11 (plasmid) [Ilyobacter polytropus DSM 2926]|uniref:Arsenite methyltransferase n=1 Tax=Ilyobacter polytropus (strain ATCC 51220 / DSM 2926 / LMG 16218 / CuHBu1) TaxID=572544 RepID=E3HC03_ILYPC|nr:methyltransferase domain-containing protein [Ilyobacter polytropus]ADO84329.1 Methyltransferase type 11 [Ilyobacter polytropus DSM 2926]
MLNCLLNHHNTKVASTAEGQFKYPTGREALERLKYDPVILRTLPESVTNSYCGTGNPFSMETIGAEEILLDFGCGAGVDAIFAAKMTKNTGRIIGLDIVSEMIKKAEINKKTLGITNLELTLSNGTILEFADEYFNTIISNSVINLVPDKETILKEFYRCLKPGGKLLLVDQVFKGTKIKEHPARVKSWFQ